MRPVDKGGKGNYPYDFNSDLSQVKLNFKKKSVINLVGKNPTLEDILNKIWLEDVKKSSIVSSGSKRPSTSQDLPSAKKVVKKRIEEIYKDAAIPLTRQLGDFCSFCETRMPGHIDVEHRVPKAEYPTYSIYWENFLLACSPCNTAKSNQPGRSLVKRWLNNPPTNEQDYYNEIRDMHYVWPDHDNNSYRFFSVDLYYWGKKADRWIKLSEVDSINLNNSLKKTDLIIRTVEAEIYETQNSKPKPVKLTRNVQVQISPKNNNSYAQEMIDLCKLNYPGDPEKTYDRRLVNRTEAWFAALTVLKPLSAPPVVTNQDIFDLIWAGVLNSAQSTGFYSVWITILERLNWTDPSGQSLLQRFINETNHPTYFPGTDITNIP